MSYPAVGKSPHPLLAKYLSNLSTHPLQTKAITTALLCFLQEVLGSNLAGVPAKKVPKDYPFFYKMLMKAHIDTRALKMAVYGFLVSAPLAHFLVGTLQKAFANRTSRGAKVAQILASNLVISPITAAAYLASMAIISGAQSTNDIIKTIQAGFWSVIRVSWIVSPLSMTIAQNYIPLHLWVPFFNTVQFVLGTYFNFRVKKLRMQKQEQERDKAE
jgi:peroxisomal membrane protein 2